MATEAAHARQANHNQLFLDSVDPAQFPDWIVTAAFYKAVHLVEGLLVRKGCPTGNHYQRNETLKRRFPGVWRGYRPLYNQSRVARYYLGPKVTHTGCLMGQRRTGHRNAGSSS